MKYLPLFAALTLGLSACGKDASGPTNPAPVDTTPTTLLSVGEVRDVPLVDGMASFRTSFTATSRHLLVVSSTTPAMSDFRMTIRANGVAAPEASVSPNYTSASAGPAESFHRALRDMERQAAGRRLARRAIAPPVRSQAPLANPPVVGDIVNFKVLSSIYATSCNDSTAVKTIPFALKYASAHGLVFVDVNTPAASLTDADAANFGALFENRFYPTDVNAFGSESDINGDGRVIILLTPQVNKLAPAGAGWYIAGFFFGADLVPEDCPVMSNGAEVFYSHVPDPDGLFGPKLPKDRAVNEVIPSTLAHEFQHMISFNQHVLVRNGNTEDLWLNEGLSHVAEMLNNFALGDSILAALYLDEPNEWSLVAGGNELRERGASFLFLWYLKDRFGPELFRRLSETGLTGMDNVAAQTGADFTQLFREWSIMLPLESGPVSSDPAYQFPSYSPRGVYAEMLRRGLRVFRGYLYTRTYSLDQLNFTPYMLGMSSSYAVITGARNENRTLHFDASRFPGMRVAIVRLQ